MPEPLPNTEYIAFADDITQITSVRYKYKDAEKKLTFLIPIKINAVVSPVLHLSYQELRGL